MRLPRRYLVYVIREGSLTLTSGDRDLTRWRQSRPRNSGADELPAWPPGITDGGHLQGEPSSCSFAGGYELQRALGVLFDVNQAGRREQVDEGAPLEHPQPDEAGA